MFKLSAKLLEEQKLSFDNHNQAEIFEDTKTSSGNPIDVEDQADDDIEDLSIQIHEDDVPQREDFSKKTKRKKKTEVEKLKIDMKGWSYLSTVKKSSSKELSDDSNLSRSFQEALRCCKEALLQMGFIYTVMKAEADVISTKQDLPLALQAVMKSAQPFFNNTVSKDSEDYIQEVQLMCGHVGNDLGNGEDVDMSPVLAFSQRNPTLHLLASRCRVDKSLYYNII